MDDSKTDADRAPDFPRYVRILAVAYVLSNAVGFVGFVVLMICAGILFMVHGGFDAWVIGLIIAALSSPLSCAIFRWWFKRWGARNWPSE
jgi:hypothetical protein